MTRTHTYFIIISLMLSGLTSFGQTNISGVINSYVSVTFVDLPTNTVTVSNASGFATGDRVLLIQMKGATIDGSQSSSFGTITNYNNAGRYEWQTVCSVTGNDITLRYDLINNYDVSGLIQLVRVPVYANALISGSDLTAQAWNGSTGGVLALELSGTLDFGSRDINVSGMGFRGGTAVTSGQGCSWSLSSNYHTSFTSADEKAYKGEGIAGSISGKECSRGPQANGGGGGNNHNGGGGGGANYGTGGGGGERIKRSLFVCGSYAGINSKSLSSGYASNRIFLGGGGGAGHVNNAVHAGENGANGAGIVIIRAATIAGNNRSVLANGNSNTINASNDGGGGGGAGGTVVLDVANYSSVLNVSVNGGSGANVINTGTSNCNGPGGGGGGGIVQVTNASVPSNLNISYSGGSRGVTATTDQSNCSVGSANNAANGQSGTSTAGFILQEGIVPIVCAGPLPVELLEFNATAENSKRVKLEWITASELNNDYFQILRSREGNSWEEIGTIKGAGNSSTFNYYHYYDNDPYLGISYYRLKQFDFDGSFTYSHIRMVKIEGINSVNVYPNPTPGNITIEIHSTTEKALDIIIFDMNGKVVYTDNIDVRKGLTQFRSRFEYLRSGVYYMRLTSQTGDFSIYRRLNVIN